MTAQQPNLPQFCEVVGMLHDTSDVNALTQDMMEVYCPSTDALIRAGWYPDEDPDGYYFVSVYQGGERVRKPYKNTQLSEIKSLIERYAVEFCRPKAEGGQTVDHGNGKRSLVDYTQNYF